MTRQQLEEMSCALNGVQVRQIRGALADAARLLEGLPFYALGREHQATAMMALETAGYIRKVLSDVRMVTAEIPEGDIEGLFDTEDTE